MMTLINRAVVATSSRKWFRSAATSVLVLALAGGFWFVSAPAAQAANDCTVCHKGRQTLRISCNAVRAHLDHGDTVGACRVTQTQNP